MATDPLAPETLYRACDPESFDFETTAELEPLEGMVGQARAVDAVHFAADMPLEGYNAFVLGPPGTGRHSFVRDFLSARARAEPTPPDRCYVNNFDEPEKPSALELPAGRGAKLRADLKALIDEVRTAIPAAFESEDYRTRRQAIENEFKEAQNRALEGVRREAAERGIQIMQTPTGIVFAPVRDGEVIGPEEFQKLPEEERRRLEEDTERLGRALQEAMQATPQRVRRTREKIRELDREAAVFAVGGLIDDLREAYRDVAKVLEHLERMKQDLIDQVDLFRQPPGEGQGSQSQAPVPHGVGAAQADPQAALIERRYAVNVLVAHEPGAGAPVVFENHPTYPRLIGKIEHYAQLGALLTDFTLVRPGALHRANGGYLVLDARKVLSEPFAWDALKQALKSRRVAIESLPQAYSPMSTVSLEPEPVALEIKVVLIGEPFVYRLLEALEPEFLELFKVVADFDDRMQRDRDSERLYARLIGTIARREALMPLERAAVARVLEESARDAADAERLSAQVRRAADVVREAHYWAGRDGDELIRREHVERAVSSRIRRQSRVRERLQEEVLRGFILVDTEGARVGQINGLAVAQVGDYLFGRPSRITARTTLGPGKVIDIEREVALGGPLHSKGVLILAGYLASHYVTDRPLSLAATLVFEQSYGGVEGDSASAAELCALLSALAGVPIEQSLAVTGSVNQYGQVQAIGAVNEKIEGFFDVCRARGLNGRQGVLIPAANAQSLMLRREVVDAAREGRFRVHAVETVDECLELLTGLEAGERGADGEFPEGSVNHRVREKLIELAEQRRAYARGGAGEGG